MTIRENGDDCSTVGIVLNSDPGDSDVGDNICFQHLSPTSVTKIDIINNEGFVWQLQIESAKHKKVDDYVPVDANDAAIGDVLFLHMYKTKILQETGRKRLCCS